MYEKYMIEPESIKNVIVDKVPVGFEFETKIPYYRGVSLSCVDNIEVWFNDYKIPSDKLTFTVDGHTYTLKEMETIATLRWEFGEKAKVFCPMDGGIGMGVHDIKVTIWIRISYGGGARPSTVHHRVNIMG
jgi:hypothetical protein